MLKWLGRIVGLAVLVIGAALVTVWWLFGGGEPYPDLSSVPRLAEGTIASVVESPRPMGNAAVSATGRIFYTIHPESNPDYPKLYEWVVGKPVAWPPGVDQQTLFATPLGIKIDGQNRLWLIDPANHGLGQPKLLALDLATGATVHTFDFPRDIAPTGSFLQDLNISPDGRFVYIADVGFWAKRPAIVVYDTAARKARRVLNRQASVYPENFLIRNPIRDMSYFGGILQMKSGVDGIAVSRDGRWLYYAAMNHDTLYRLPAAVLNDFSTLESDIEAKIEAVGKKPLNDGIATDADGNVFVTDIEHSAVLELAPDGKLTTVVKDKRIRWADGLAFGPDGWLYLADSAIPEIILQSATHHAAAAPYHIWRFKPGTAAAPGQ